MDQPSTESILSDLEPVAEKLLNRHLRAAKEWFPHELVPWSEGRDYSPEEPWNPGKDSPPAGVRSALLVNLLTEENLPYYFAALDRLGLRDGPWGEWSRRWTAEEARHGSVIRSYVLVTRALDARQLERDRMHAMTRGFDPSGLSLLDGIVYAALQELATRIAHRNTGKQLDPRGYEIMARVAADENLHFLFYRDLVGTLLETHPSSTVCSLTRQVIGFRMPGNIIRNFREHSHAIAAAGIYDLGTHYDGILKPLLIEWWKVDQLPGVTPEAEQARARLVGHLARVERTASRLRERRHEEGERALRARTENVRR